MMPNYWKCSEEGCDDSIIYAYKGLCRSCTTYELGEPKKAVHRVKVNQDGSKHHQHSHTARSQPITRREKMEMDKQYAKDRKVSTKMRKVRQIMRDEGIDMNHVCDDSCNHSEELQDMIEIGESVHVHDENCNHEEE